MPARPALLTVIVVTGLPVILAGVLALNLLRLPPMATSAPAAAPALQGQYAKTLARAIRFATLTPGADDGTVRPAFKALFTDLAARFPLAHKSLEIIKFSDSRLLFWPGSEPALAPGLLLAHSDVVPATTDWTVPPFSGAIRDGFIHGRGSLDNKSALVAQLAAVEELLGQGLRPRRGLYLAFGHDEESGGGQGAAMMAAWLRQRHESLAFVIDEGGAVVTGVIPGMTAPVALIGIAEKGFANLRLTVRGDGGHSSMPPARTAIAGLSAALARLDAEPLPSRLPAATAGMFRTLAPHMGLGHRLMLANLWLTEPLLLRQLASKASTNAVIRSTGVTTLIGGGDKDNVLPTAATAVRNYRLLPGDTPESILLAVRRRLADTAIEVELLPGAWPPSATAATDSAAWRALTDSYAAVFPGAVPAPYLSVVMTDSRHYRDLTTNIYRTLPVMLSAGDLSRIHGRDERIAETALADMVRFYKVLITRLVGAP